MLQKPSIPYGMSQNIPLKKKDRPDFEELLDHIIAEHIAGQA
jgi:hypothetical protein